MKNSLMSRLRKLLHSRSWLLLLAVVLFTGSAAASKPIAVVAGGARYDVSRFVRGVLAPSGYVWQDCGTFLDPGEFERYSLVVWFYGCHTNFNQRQVEDLKDYLTGGGRILHTAGGLYNALGRRNLKEYSWLGVDSWHYINLASSRRSFPFLQPHHSFCTAIDSSHNHHWQDGYYTVTLNTNVAHNIIGDERQSILCTTPVGQGEITWLWEGPFRARNHEFFDDGIAFERLLRNILDAAQPLQAATLMRNQTPAIREDPTAMVVWRRDWSDFFQDDYIFLPPHPEPGEELTQLTFNSAIDEYDTQFLLCQSATSQELTVTATPLVRESDKREYRSHLQLFLSDRPPLVPSLVRKGEEERPAKMGRFMLLPLTNDVVAIESWRPRVIWLQLHTAGLTPGCYQATLNLQGKSTRKELPIKVKVYPVQMPTKRLAELRWWGGAIPIRQPFLRELVRQGCHEISLTRPKGSDIRLLDSGITLQDALQNNAALFRQGVFPRLDFRGAYETNLLAALDHNITIIQLLDGNTGKAIVHRTLGSTVGSHPREWPDYAQQLYTDYYRELYHYLQERGFHHVNQVVGDEPSMGSITSNYLPHARLLTTAGIGVGSTWTASGFRTPEELNTFAPYTTDWSMYSITFNNFLRFVREGSVKLHPRAMAGMTRGGCGYALRNPFNRSRTMAWEMVYYGQPINYLRTGPIWKEWLYYSDYDRSAKNRSIGIEGERLLAYGSSDPQDGSVAMLSSSDWESSREGVDDVNLVRMLEWYLDYFEKRGGLNLRRRQMVRRIRREMRSWFTLQDEISETSGFDGTKLVEQEESAIPDATGNTTPHFMIEQKLFGSGATPYRYERLIPPPGEQLEALKKRVLDHLESLRPYVSEVGGSLLWHDWALLEDGKRCFEFLTAPGSERLTTAIDDFAARCEELSGCRPAVRESAAWTPQRQRVSLLLGTSEDPTIQQLLREMGRTVDNTYPGPGSYLILRQAQHNTILVVGTDEPGLLLGLKNFAVFLEGRGKWLLP